MEPQKRKKLNPNHHHQLIKNPSVNRDHVPDHQDQLEIKVMKIEIKAMIIEVQAMIIEIEVMIVEIIEIKVMTVEIEAMIVEIETDGFTQKEKSVVLIESGRYKGHGLVPDSVDLTSVQEVKHFIQTGYDDQDMQAVIMSHISKTNREEEVIVL